MLENIEDGIVRKTNYYTGSMWIKIKESPGPIDTEIRSRRLTNSKIPIN